MNADAVIDSVRDWEAKHLIAVEYSVAEEGTLLVIRAFKEETK